MASASEKTATDGFPDSAGLTAAGICRSIVAETVDAVIFADAEGRIRLWNRSAERLFGYAASEVIGQSLDIIIPEHLRERHWKGFDAALAAGHTKYTGRVLTTRSMHKDGHRLYVDLGFGLVYRPDGSVAGAFATGRDATTRHAEDLELRARLAALEAGGAGKDAGTPATAATGSKAPQPPGS